MKFAGKRLLWGVFFGVNILLFSGIDLPAAAPPGVAGEARVADGRAVVNFTQLAAAEAKAAKLAGPPPRKPLHPLMRPSKTAQPAATQAPALAPMASVQAEVASPSPTGSFLGLGDDNTSIPPDTQGAVGPNHVVTMLNTQVRIQTRAGATLSTVSLDSFWSAVGGSPSCFDPHIRFDPYGNRWIVTASANSTATNSLVLVGVSQSSDPTGNWNLYKVTADPTGVRWADYPALGFNKDWVVVSMNLFPISNVGAVYEIGRAHV